MWAFEKGVTPRKVHSFQCEGAEHGYFAGAKNEDELEIDKRFNETYELPFNNLLPAMDANLQILQSQEVRNTCSLYVAHLFHRMRAMRIGRQLLR